MSAATHAPGTQLHAGAATVDITPAGSVFLYGYPHVPRNSTGVHDPLECAALYLRKGDGAVLFLANDLIYVTRDFVAAVRRRIRARVGLPEHAIMITATHTHSGPIMSDHLSNAADPVLPKVDPAYLAWLGDRLVAAAEAAVAAVVPAELGLAVARAEGVGSNRHDPAGPTDPDVPLLVARDARTRVPLACMIVYGMHPTVLHEDSTLISADFPYFTRRHLRSTVLPPAAAVIYHNGASGDQSPRHVTRENTFAEAQRLGETLGRALAAAFARVEFSDVEFICCRARSVELEPRGFPTVEAARRREEEVRARYERLRASGAPRQHVRTAECDVFGAEETTELARAAVDGRLSRAIAGCSPAEIQLVELGGWRFVAWPGEFFAAYALEVRRAAPDTFVITLANGELQGYVVTAEAAERGVYEATNAIFSAANGPRIVAASLELLGVAAPR